MALPVVPLLLGASFGLSSIYNTGKALDTRAYWNDYYRNTGYRPRYSYRSGMYDWMKNDMYMLGSFRSTYSSTRRHYYYR